MKTTIKYQEVNPVESVTIELTGKEARLLKVLMGVLAGGAPIRDELTNNLWRELDKMTGFKYESDAYKEAEKSLKGLFLSGREFSK